MKVPLLDLRPPLEELHDEIVKAVTQVIDSTCYIMGPEIDGLEKELSREFFLVLFFHKDDHISS